MKLIQSIKIGAYTLRYVIKLLIDNPFPCNLKVIILSRIELFIIDKKWELVGNNRWLRNTYRGPMNKLYYNRNMIFQVCTTLFLPLVISIANLNGFLLCD